MKTQHTPGPWKTNSFGVIEDRSGSVIAGVLRYGSVSGELPMNANAELIAAAPELLDTLSECLEQLEQLHYLYEGEFSERIEAADEAAKRAWKLIAKLTDE